MYILARKTNNHEVSFDIFENVDLHLLFLLYKFYCSMMLYLTFEESENYRKKYQVKNDPHESDFEEDDAKFVNKNLTLYFRGNEGDIKIL